MEDKNIFDCQEYVIQMMFYNKEVSINTGINVCPQGDKGGFMNTCASTLETTVEWNEKFLPRETRQGAALGGGGAFELGWSPGAHERRDNKLRLGQHYTSWFLGTCNASWRDSCFLQSSLFSCLLAKYGLKTVF